MENTAKQKMIDYMVKLLSEADEKQVRLAFIFLTGYLA